MNLNIDLDLWITLWLFQKVDPAPDSEEIEEEREAKNENKSTGIMVEVLYKSFYKNLVKSLLLSLSLGHWGPESFQLLAKHELSYEKYQTKGSNTNFICFIYSSPINMYTIKDHSGAQINNPLR